MSDLHFVFLQGMPCSFFRRIGDKLSGQGHRVSRINLCFGDWLFWHGPEAHSYRGRYADWPAFFTAFIQENKVTDLVLLGEQRKYHKEAVKIALFLGVRVVATDFGYLRPDWITLEQDGMGGNSRFPRDPATILAHAASVPKADLDRRYSDSAVQMALGDLLFSFANVLVGWLRFPFYQRSEARPHPLIYFPAIGRRLLTAGKRNRRASERFQSVLASGAAFFVLPLQLEHDFQIVAYSPFDGLDEVIELVIHSFAAHADRSSRLLLKSHPWDPGLKRWPRLIAEVAGRFGVADRIDYLDGGDLDGMMARAAGVVTVNSTSGLRALQLGCPVKLLGQAVYDVPGLSDQGSLDAFWQTPLKPDPQLRDAFVDLMAETIQIRGVFFSEPGATVAVEAAASRLAAGIRQWPAS